MAQSSLLFIGIKGTVLALDRATGQEVWRTNLKATDFVNVVYDDGDLFAAARGELYCLDAATGQVRWRNPLKGLGFGLMTVASAGGQQSVILGEKRRKEAEAAAAHSATMG